jgi:hypothetical protein
MSLCKYQNIFGKVNDGVHSYRLFDLAIVDVIMTIIAGFIISKTFDVSFIQFTFLLFIIGIIMHRLFCVRTTIDKLLFV